MSNYSPSISEESNFEEEDRTGLLSGRDLTVIPSVSSPFLSSFSFSNNKNIVNQNRSRLAPRSKRSMISPRFNNGSPEYSSINTGDGDVEADLGMTNGNNREDGGEIRASTAVDSSSGSQLNHNGMTGGLESDIQEKKKSFHQRYYYGGGFNCNLCSYNRNRTFTEYFRDVVLQFFYLEWKAILIIVLLFLIWLYLIMVEDYVAEGVSEYLPPEFSYSMLQDKNYFRKGNSFFNFYTSSLDNSLFFVEFPLSYFSPDGDTSKQQPIIVSASVAKGLYVDNQQVLLYHEPAETTEQNVFTFALLPDMSGIKVIRQQYSVRTEIEAIKDSVNVGVDTGYIDILDTVALNRGGYYSEPSIIIDGSKFLLNGFYVNEHVKLAAGIKVDMSQVHSYPQNYDLTVSYSLLNPLDMTLQGVDVSFAVALLPIEPMKSRAYDSRVGYFSTTFTNLGDYRNDSNYDNFSTHERYKIDPKMQIINKRRFEKKKSEDATAVKKQKKKVPEDKVEIQDEDIPEYEPLKYYIDPTVPEKYREAFRNGVEGWQEAFEAAGMGPKAIVAVLPGDKDWPDDYHASDIRYSSITWSVDTGSVFALAPSTVDPRSGEILDSDIIFTHGWILSWISRVERNLMDQTVSISGRNLGEKDYIKDSKGKFYDDLINSIPVGILDLYKEVPSKSINGKRQDIRIQQKFVGLHHHDSYLTSKWKPPLSSRRSMKAVFQYIRQSFFGRKMNESPSYHPYAVPLLLTHGEKSSEKILGKNGDSPSHVNITPSALESLSKAYPSLFKTSHSHHHHHHANENKHSHHDDSETNKERTLFSHSIRSHIKGMCQHEKTYNDLSPLIAALVMGAEPNDDDFTVSLEVLKAGITEVVLHEVGHSLGLRHNFKGSLIAEYEKISDVEYTSKEGITSSVMDYLPMNVMSNQKKNVTLFPTAPGSYDKMAIFYGYSVIEDEVPGIPNPSLQEIANHGIPFSTDEDGSRELGPDPYVRAFDFTNDPIRYFLDQTTLVEKLRKQIHEGERSVNDGDPYTVYGPLESILVNFVIGNAQMAGKFIGGVDISRPRYNEALVQGIVADDEATNISNQEKIPPPIQFIPLSTQMRALNLILRVLVEDGGDDTIAPMETTDIATKDYVYSSDATEVFGLPIELDEALDTPRKSFLLPTPNSYNYMVQTGGYCEGQFQYCYAQEPVEFKQTVDTGRQAMITYLLAEERLSRLLVQEWAQEGQGLEAMTLSLYLSTITKALYGPGLDDIEGLTDDTEDPELINTLYPKTLLKSKWSIQSFWIDALISVYVFNGDQGVSVTVMGEISRIQSTIDIMLQGTTATTDGGSVKLSSKKNVNYPILSYVRSRIENFYTNKS